MSLRALGRQFGHFLNPPATTHSTGRMFEQPYPKYHVDADVAESGRRRMAGEANPAAPWKTPMLQHHFLPTHDRQGRMLPAEPVQGKFKL